MINTNKFVLVSINRCMDYAKVADGIKLVPKYETCHVEESIRTVLHCLSSAADKDQVRLAPLPSSMCSHILTDKQWLQENILCLLSNAVKFTPHGKIDLRLTLTTGSFADQFDDVSHPGTEISRSEKSCTNRSGVVSPSPVLKSSPSWISTSGYSACSAIPMILVEVEDNGVGISQDMQSRLFAPFQQAQKNAGGTGLGLYSLAKRVEALGGKYGVKDRLDGQQGSLFWFTFPYRPDTITESMMRYDGNGSQWITAMNESDDSVMHRDADQVKTTIDLLAAFSVSSSFLFASPPAATTNNPPNVPSLGPMTKSGKSPSFLCASAPIVPLNLEGSGIVGKDTGCCNTHHEDWDGNASSATPSDRTRAMTSSFSNSNRGSFTSLSATTGRGTKKSHRKYKVLLADDSTAIRNMLVKILQRGGHDVTPVGNGLEALEAIQNALTNADSPGPFDVVILDLHMPVLDGFETMQRIRAQEQRRPSAVDVLSSISRSSVQRQFVIGCSANDDEETIADMIEAGADASLAKPFTLTQFEDCMNNYLTNIQN